MKLPYPLLSPASGHSQALAPNISSALLVAQPRVHFLAHLTCPAHSKQQWSDIVALQVEEEHFTSLPSPTSVQLWGYLQEPAVNSPSPYWRLSPMVVVPCTPALPGSLGSAAVQLCCLDGEGRLCCLAVAGGYFLNFPRASLAQLVECMWEPALTSLAQPHSGTPLYAHPAWLTQPTTGCHC